MGQLAWFLFTLRPSSSRKLHLKLLRMSTLATSAAAARPPASDNPKRTEAYPIPASPQHVEDRYRRRLLVVRHSMSQRHHLLTKNSALV